MVHHQLLHLKALSNPTQLLSSAMGKLSGTEAAVAGSHTRVETRKTAMQAQDLTEVADLKLSPSKRSTVKVAFANLAKVAQLHINQYSDYANSKLRKQLGGMIDNSASGNKYHLAVDGKATG